MFMVTCVMIFRGGLRPEIRAEYEHIENFYQGEARHIILMIDEQGVESAVDYMSRLHDEGTHPIVSEHERTGEIYWCLDYVVTVNRESQVVEFEHRIDSV